MLAGGDRRSIGRADQVVDLSRLHPEQISVLIECLWDTDPILRMRASDALEKISREQPDILQQRKASLLGLLAETNQQEVRWHLAVTIPRLQLTASECEHVADRLQMYLNDRSSIVKTFALQGLSDLTLQHAGLQPTVVKILRTSSQTGTLAMRARARLLLHRLETPAN